MASETRNRSTSAGAVATLASVTIRQVPVARAQVGRVLGDQREQAGLTQATAARRLGMPQSRLAEIETGAARCPIDDALAMVELYGGAFSDLDVRGKDPSFANVRRGRGRPRKMVEFHFSVSEPTKDDGVAHSIILLKSAEASLYRNEKDQARLNLLDGLWGLLAPRMALRVRSWEAFIEAALDQSDNPRWPDAIRTCVLLFLLTGSDDGAWTVDLSLIFDATTELLDEWSDESR
jgi:transcriptional regulator with XRE-family HTH domain